MTPDLPVIWRNVRKSFHSLINGSAKEISIRRFNAATDDQHVIQCWNHLRAVSKNIITDAMVRLVVDWVRNGHGEISAGFTPDGNCIGVVVILDDHGKSLYHAGHYVEDKRGKRHSHFMVFDALARAKERKSDRFYFSTLDPDPYETNGRSFAPDPRMVMGRFFMRGFATDAVRQLTYVRSL